MAKSMLGDEQRSCLCEALWLNYRDVARHTAMEAGVILPVTRGYMSRGDIAPMVGTVNEGVRSLGLWVT